MSDDLFGGPTVEDVTLERQVQCVEREIALRTSVYKRWVELERISQRQADEELLCMRAVLATLQRLEDTQR